MGQFSWLYSDTGKSMKNNRLKDSFLLVPPEWQQQYGHSIKETCYDGYGHMGIYDIFELVAIWNRHYIPGDYESIANSMPNLEQYRGMYEFEKEELRKKGYTEEQIIEENNSRRKQSFERGLQQYQHNQKMIGHFSSDTPDGIMKSRYGSSYLREIGIILACYDEDNAKLRYPIKITTKDSNYEKVSPSKSDPNQGW